MAFHTITYSEAVQGWPSFYSFNPDWMIGMNNYFYTFHGGNLYVHNSDDVNRNNFYGIDYSSTLQTVINDSPLENKLFKTISLQGDSVWDVQLQTDIQTDSFIDSDWFDKKEQVYFAFIRNPNDVPATLEEYHLRSLNGIGRSLDVTGVPTALHIEFSINPLIQISSVISVGDYLYYAPPPYDTPVYCGQITNIIKDYPNEDNYIEVNTTGGSVPTDVDDYFLSIKNGIAESSGILGHYLVVDL